MEPRALPRSGLFNTSSSRPKSYALIFPSPSKAAATTKLLIPSEEGSDPAASELRRRGKSSSSSSPLLLGVGGGRYIITITKTSTISIIISVIHSVPLVVDSCYTLDTCLVLLFMFLIEYLSLFGGEVIFSDCVVPFMPLNIIMFACCE